MVPAHPGQAGLSALQYALMNTAESQPDAPVTTTLSSLTPDSPYDLTVVAVDASMPEHRHGMNYAPTLRTTSPTPPARTRG